MVTSSKSQAFWGSTCLTRRRFKVFVGLIEKLHGVSLPFPDFSESRSSFKDFCSAILERRKHYWDIALAPLGADSRKSIAMSLFLFRKIIPSDRPDAFALLKKVATPSPPACGRFLEFVEQEVNRLMPVGWDRDYVQKGIASVVPTKSYSELNGIDGCSRDWFISHLSYGDWCARHNFIEKVLTLSDPILNETSESRLVVVPSSGKYRALSIPPVEMNYLRPLHKCMYDYLSRYSWLLRGDAKPSAFKGFETKEGEMFCSGDYESATDNLNSEVQKEILRCVLQNARNVPKGLIVSAMRSFSLKLALYGRDGNLVASMRQQSGQMMGNLLSFPLLCLVNYITFRWLTMDSSIPVRINGDDIVFRAKPEVIERWKLGVSASGLTLSEGKTMVDGRYFSLNSTLFKGTRKRVRLVPFIRSKALFGIGEDDSVASLRGRFHSFIVGYGNQLRSRARVVFLKENSGWIKKSCRSLTQGLGICVEPEVILEAGMWSREMRYLAEVEKPLPNLPGEFAHMPDGYHLRWVDKETKKRRSSDKGLQAAFIDAAWKPRNDNVSWKTREEVYCSGLNLSDAAVLKSSAWATRMARLGGKFLRTIYGELKNTYRWIKTRFSHVKNLWKKPSKKFPCWYSDSEENQLFFVDGGCLCEQKAGHSFDCTCTCHDFNSFGLSEMINYKPTISGELYSLKVKEQASLGPLVQEELVINAQEITRPTRSYNAVAPPLILTDPDWFDEEDQLDSFIQ